MTVGENTVDVSHPSPFGLIAGLLTMVTAAIAGMFERWSWMRPAGAHVERWSWNLRVAMYLGFSVPGFLLSMTDYRARTPLERRARDGAPC